MMKKIKRPIRGAEERISKKKKKKKAVISMIQYNQGLI